MIHRSPLPDIDIPEVTITQFVLQRSDLVADKPALIDGVSGAVLTYGQLVTRVRRLALGLRGRGFGKGDTFAIYSPNIPDFAVAVHGVLAAGGTLTTINPLATARELADQLRDSGATYLLTHPALLATACQAAAQAGTSNVFVFGEQDGMRPFDELFAEDGPWPDIDMNVYADPAVVPYSSGTTGLPKGVMLTHHNLVSNTCQPDGFDVIGPDDTVVAFLPWFHVYGLWLFLFLGLAQGATMVTLPRFDLEQYLALNQDHRASRMFVVPPVLVGLAKHPVVVNYDLSSLKSVASAAAPASRELCEAVQHRLGCEVLQGFGMTELSPCATLQPPGAGRLGTSGVTIPNTEIMIADPDTGQGLGPGERGEVWVRGPQVMLGYLNRPDATAETITHDGWLKTGDIGVMDADGYLTIVDRLKELIKVNAYQVAPAELEALLLTHPSVADAAVIGVPHPETGESPKAFVVARAEIAGDEIMGWVADQVAPYKRIRQIEFVDAIPKSASGKILRTVLRDRERQAVVG